MHYWERRKVTSVLSDRTRNAYRGGLPAQLVHVAILRPPIQAVWVGSTGADELEVVREDIAVKYKVRGQLTQKTRR